MCIDLAATLGAHELDTAARVAQNNLIRTIVGGIGGDDNAQLLRGIVQRERIFDFGLDHVGLVVRGDDQRDARLDIEGVDVAGQQRRPRKREERISHVRPDEQRKRDPADGLEQVHIRKGSRQVAGLARTIACRRAKIRSIPNAAGAARIKSRIT